MKAKVIYLAGVPASGKTTIFNKIRIAYFQGGKEFKHGLARGIQSRDGRFFMLGVYDGSAFEGTDKLSMAVINDAIDFCQKQETQCVVFVEGDRLFNIRFMRETGATLYLIDANPNVLKARHAKRGDNQSERFLRSRRTKVENFISTYYVNRLMNDTADQSARIYNHIINTAETWLKNA